jgi:hypothetical protein
MCAEELTNDAALIRVKRVLLDVNTVPYAPEFFSAKKSSRVGKFSTTWNNFYCSVTSAD